MEAALLLFILIPQATSQLPPAMAELDYAVLLFILSEPHSQINIKNIRK